MKRLPSLDALRALECAALPLLGFVAPNGWGIALLAGQAVAVAVFAELYIMALRRANHPIQQGLWPKNEQAAQEKLRVEQMCPDLLATTSHCYQHRLR